MNKLLNLIIVLFISLGFVTAIEAAEQLPMTYVKTGAKTPSCGKGGKTPYVKNTHASKSILVNLHVKYIYNGDIINKDVGNYNLMPGQTKKLTSRCSVPGPTSQLFTYYATAAQWL